MFVFIQKQHLESFALLFPKILKLFTREVSKFLKKQANLFLNVCEQTFHISHERISQNVKGFLM